ncbi:MAG: transcription antitermination factor NusB [Oscillospiraceae bacterium]|nr:transcription antitermination factor NusB [Oscillospiraceae bacterium]MDE7094449.1 transcription antitermination factor NusB [Oscillospiraceae bacterium]
MKKQQCRENAFLILFEASFRNDTLEELFAIANEIGEIEINSQVEELVKHIIAETENLDEIIAVYSPKRALNRIARVNLILLRMAIYELKYCSETPMNVVVSEAVRLSELYASSEDTAFINGILGNYTRKTRKEEI